MQCRAPKRRRTNIASVYWGSPRWRRATPRTWANPSAEPTDTRTDTRIHPQKALPRQPRTLPQLPFLALRGDPDHRSAINRLFTYSAGPDRTDPPPKPHSDNPLIGNWLFLPIPPPPRARSETRNSRLGLNQRGWAVRVRIRLVGTFRPRGTAQCPSLEPV